MSSKACPHSESGETQMPHSESGATRMRTQMPHSGEWGCPMILRAVLPGDVYRCLNMGHRNKQIASTLHQAIQQVLARGLHDPRIAGLITVTSVDVAEDLKNATVYISVLPEEKQKKTYYGLRDAARHIRHEVSNIVAMHQVPQFTFKLDSGLKKEAEALHAIAKIAEERKRIAGEIEPVDAVESAESPQAEAAETIDNDDIDDDKSTGGERV